MAWEILAIWVLVAATLVWFFRDERKAQFARLSERARTFATGEAWRHRPEPIRRLPAEPDSRDLTDIQRRFLEEVRRQKHR